MLYTGIIAALSSLDLGIKWLIEQEKPEEFPKPLPHAKGKILLYRNHNAGFPFGFLEQHAELVRMLPLTVISGLAGFLTAILPQKGKTVQKFGIAVILGGAVSNLYDRMIRHYVVDYFSIQCGKLKKVVFNLGDIFVFLGSGILFYVRFWRQYGHTTGGGFDPADAVSVFLLGGDCPDYGKQDAGAYSGRGW